MKRAAGLALLAWIALGFAAPAHADWNVSGKFGYEDRVYGPAGFTGTWDTLAIRSAIVEIVDAGSGSVLARGGSSADGSFAFSVPGSPGGNVYARALTWAADSTRYRLRVRQSIGGAIFAVASPPVAASASVQFNGGLPLVAVRQGAGEAFNVLDNLENGVDYVSDISGGTRPALALTGLWSPSSGDGTYYSGGYIHLLKDDGYSDAVIAHEEGHFMAAVFSRDDSPGGTHFLGDNDQPPSLAFSEGWATYFSLSTRRHFGLANPSWYCDMMSEANTLPALNFSYEIETPSVGAAGGNSEVSVQAALWDIADDAATADVAPGVDDDPLDLSDDQTWGVLTGYLPTLHGGIGQQSTLETFWEGWFAQGRGHLDEMRQAFRNEAIEFFPDSAGNDDFAARAVLATGLPEHRTFYPRGDVDWFRFQAIAGREYVAETTGLLGGANTKLTLYGPDSTTQLAVNDDRAPGLAASRINFTPAVSGAYFLKCQQVPGLNVFGSYDLRVLEGAPTTAVFNDVTQARGVTGGGNARGVAWGDYNRDGYPDLYVCFTGAIVGTGARDRLFRNNAGLGFTEVASAQGVEAGVEQHEGAAWGDYDNDGYADLVVVSIEGLHLFRNNGAPGYTLTDVTAAAGVQDSGFARSVAWVDFDRDGRLDFYVTRYSGDALAPCTLYHNNGNGTFTRLAVGVEYAGHAFSSAWTDFDGDGRPDVALGLDGEVDGRGLVLYRQKPDGTFEDAGAAAGITAHGGRIFGVAWADYDGDGWMDLVAANQTGPNYLFHNRGNGTFEDVSYMADIQGELKGTSPAWLDIDNDADLDLYVVNFGAPASMFDNLGEGVFTTSGLAGTQNESRAVAVADYNRDGSEDAYVAAQTVNTLYEGAPVAGNHFLELSLSGRTSNASAIGARAQVRLSGGQTLWREVSGGQAWGSQPSATLHFGLGTATSAESVVIHWPSGLLTALGHVAADQVLGVDESGGGDSLPASLALLPNVPNPFSQSTQVRFDIPPGSAGQAVRIAVYNVSGRLERVLVDRAVAAGRNLQVQWDGRLQDGGRAPQGVHFCRMTASGLVMTRKMILLH